MHAMHFDGFAIHILLNCHIFFNFGINNIMHLEKFCLFFFIPLWNCYLHGDVSGTFHSGDFLFTISVDDMAPTRDSDTKNYSMS